MSIKIAIAGYGNLGRGVECALNTSQDMELVGVFSRRDPKSIQTKTNVPVYHIDEAVKFKDDIDVMILVDTDRAGVSPLEKKICDVTYDFNDEHGTDIMPVVQSNTHFDYWKKADMFYRNVEKDGVVI